MTWFLKVNYIIKYFHILIILGLLVIGDYILFSFIVGIYDTYFTLLILALFSGIGMLISMNTCLHLIKTIKKNIHLGSKLHKKFIQFLIVLFAGSLMTFPGIITSIIGWVIYFKPLRMILTNLLYQYKPQIFIRLYSHFLVEYTSD